MKSGSSLLSKPWFTPLSLGFVLFITLLAYIKVFGFDFIDWDDQASIVNNPLITQISLENFKQFFTFERYTSLTLLSFSVDYYFFGFSSGAFHAVNLLIHLVNIVLVYMLARKLNIAPAGALAAAILFAMHPTRVETVSWVMQRKDLLYVMFFLSGTLLYIRYLQKGARNLIMILLVFILGYLSLLSKIQAYSFPVIMVLTDVYFKRRFDFRNILEKTFIFIIFAFGTLNLYNWISVLIAYAFCYNYDFFTVKKNFPYLQKREPGDSAGMPFMQITRRHIVVVAAILICLLLTIFRIKYVSIVLFSLSFYLAGKYIEWVILKYTRGTSMKRLIVILVPSAMLLVLIAIVFLVKSDLGISRDLPEQESNILYRLILAAYSLSFYIIRFIYPFDLNTVEIYPLMNGGKFPLLYYLSFILPLLILAALFIFRKKIKQHRRQLIFFILFFLVNIFMMLHVIPMRGRVVVANRYTYLAYVGLFLLAGYIIAHYLSGKKKLLPVIVMMVCAVSFSIYDFTISSAFRNSKVFWEYALKQDPGNHIAWSGLGTFYAAGNEFSEARKAFDKSISIYPYDGYSFNNRGVLRLNTEDYAGAADDLSEAIRLKDAYSMGVPQKNGLYDLSETYFNRGNAYLCLKDYQRSLDDYNTAILMFNANPAYYSNRALAKLCLNDTASARQDIWNTLYMDPQNVVAIAARGIYLARTDHPKEANADIAEALTKEPSLAQLFGEIGLDLQQLTGLNLPDNAGAGSSQGFVDSGIGKARSGMLKEALADFDQAAALDPKNYLAFMNRANLKLDLRDFPGSVEDCDRTLELAPNEARAYFIRGTAHFNMGDRQAACRDWNDAARLGHPRAEQMLSLNCR